MPTKTKTKTKPKVLSNLTESVVRLCIPERGAVVKQTVTQNSIPDASEVLVQVKYVAVTAKERRCWIGVSTSNYLGCCAVGIVLKVGKGVTKLKPKDAVSLMRYPTRFRNKVLVSENLCCKVKAATPENILHLTALVDSYLDSIITAMMDTDCKLMIVGNTIESQMANYIMAKAFSVMSIPDVGIIRKDMAVIDFGLRLTEQIPQIKFQVSYDSQLVPANKTVSELVKLNKKLLSECYDINIVPISRITTVFGTGATVLSVIEL